VEWGAFGEYKWNKRRGIRTGILFYFTQKSVHNPFWELIVPILVTNYLCPNYKDSMRIGQFCLLYGVEGKYRRGRQPIVDRNKFQEVHVGITAAAGLQYEFSFGLILGISVTQSLIDIVKTGQPDDKWRLHTLEGWWIYPTIGINFVKLFNKLSNRKALPIGN
jgi:hypothetical protein